MESHFFPCVLPYCSYKLHIECLIIEEIPIESLPSLPNEASNIMGCRENKPTDFLTIKTFDDLWYFCWHVKIWNVFLFSFDKTETSLLRKVVGRFLNYISVSWLVNQVCVLKIESRYLYDPSSYSLSWKDLKRKS